MVLRNTVCLLYQNQTTMEISKRTKHGWVIGKVENVTFEAVVYDEASEFGINDGKVSKLFVKQAGKMVAQYDRRWEIKPKDMNIVSQIVAKLEATQF